MVKESDMKCKKFMTLQNMADELSINAVSRQNFPFQRTVYYQYCGCAMLIISITALVLLWSGHGINYLVPTYLLAHSSFCCVATSIYSIIFLE